MSQATTIRHEHDHEPEAKPSRGTVPFMVFAIIILVTAALSNWRPAASEVHEASIAPGAPAAVTATSDNSVPKASTVFAGTDTLQEEAAPTF